MKKLNILAILFAIIHVNTTAQSTIELKNPLAEARFNFFKKTVLVFNEYLDTDSGSFNTTDIRILYPVKNNKWNLRADLPIVSSNTNSINKTGIGDLAGSVAYIPYATTKSAVAIRTKISANTASYSSLGSGKWVFTPTLFWGNYLNSEKKLLLISSLETQQSFAGDSNRSKVNTTVVENILLYNFGKNWVGTNVALRYNATVEGWQNSSFIEFGRKFASNSLFYLHPSIAYGNKKSYNSGMEIGMLVFF